MKTFLLEYVCILAQIDSICRHALDPFAMNWRDHNDTAIVAGSLKFDSRTVLITHSVANSSTPLRLKCQFFIFFLFSIPVLDVLQIFYVSVVKLSVIYCSVLKMTFRIENRYNF